MPTIAINAAPEQMTVSDSDQAEMKAVRLKRRIYELISSVSRLSVSCGWEHECPMAGACDWLLYGVAGHAGTTTTCLLLVCRLPRSQSQTLTSS